MTPLAHRIARELTLPPNKRTLRDGCGLLNEFYDVHCFEVSGVLEAMRSIVWPAGIKTATPEVFWDHLGEVSRQTSFLPAPRTWIEWADDKGRIGFLLQEDEGFAIAQTAALSFEDRSFKTHGFLWAFGLGAKGSELNHYHASRDLADAEERDICEHMAALHGFLAFINSPRVIGRQQHAPHRGLARKIAAKAGPLGGQRLHPWTEIKLHVTPPRDAAGDGEHEAHLNGQRALHFCRSHLRVRNGRLETVRAHWRGDSSLGVKRSHYKLVADKGIENAA